MADIVLKDRDGNDVTYAGVESVLLHTADGGTQVFHKGEPQEKTVELDFSEGWMRVLPDSGKVLKKVTIAQPDTLTPGNIAEGVNIAGIVGTLAGGGNGVKCAYGDAVVDDIKVVVSHNLGVIPDYVMAIALGVGDGCIIDAMGKSTALRKAEGASAVQPFGHNTDEDRLAKSNFVISSEGIDISTSNPINCANETTFTIGSDKHPACGGSWYWIAISGLT